MSALNTRNVKMIFIYIAYWIGIILDMLSAIATTIYMLSPRETFVNTIMKFPPISEGTFVILITETALMWGWTALLFWGNRKPLERRGVLLLTLVPVITVIIMNTIIGLARGNPYMSYARLFLIAVFTIILTGYILAELTVKNASMESGDTSSTV